MCAQPYQTTDIGSKQHIMRQADPSTTLSLCQVDSASRKACGQLPVDEKVKLCLVNDANAREQCDKIPMFSMRQFFALIPPQIRVEEGDTLMLTHNFYPQNYKLKEEGFSTALYKAKLMNTIMAVLRPNVLIEYADRLPMLPPYVNASVVEAFVADYNRALEEYPLLNIRVELYSSIASPYVNSSGFYLNASYRRTEEGILPINFALRDVAIGTRSFEEQKINRKIIDAIIADHFLEQYNHYRVYGNAIPPYVEPFLNIAPDPDGHLNYLAISRMAKILLDNGVVSNARVMIEASIDGQGIDARSEWIKLD